MDVNSFKQLESDDWNLNINERNEGLEGINKLMNEEDNALYYLVFTFNL